MSVENNKKYDNLCKAGCIISIIFSVILMFSFFIYSIIFFVSSSYQLGFIILFFSFFEMFVVIFCSNVLKEKAKSHITAGIFALIFTGIIGGVLILVGKYEKQKIIEE